MRDGGDIVSKNVSLSSLLYHAFASLASRKDSSIDIVVVAHHVRDM